MYITGESTEVDVYSTYFDENSASTVKDVYTSGSATGKDVYTSGSATVTIHDTCPAGYGVVQGGSLSTSGTIIGPKYSYTCPPCPAGSYSTSGASCIACGAGKYATIVVGR